MPQFSPRLHRARERLDELGRRLPDLWPAVEAQRLADPPSVDVYVSGEQAARALAVAALQQGRGAIDLIQRAGPSAPVSVALLARWRMTQGVYRVDPALYPALAKTELHGDIPADVLRRLPEWCIYLETPDLQRGNGMRVYGAWASLEHAATGAWLLSIAIDSGAPSDALVLDTHTIEIRGQLAEAIDGGLAPSEQDGRDEVLATLTPIINVLLYIGHAADIAGHGAPANPTPIRTRRNGWRLFPAQGLRAWDVGARMGAALRAAFAAEQAGQGEPHAGPRPHVRRAHWHTILSGPRLRNGLPIPSGERLADLRWMPPIAVNVDDVGNLVATVRPVR